MRNGVKVTKKNMMNMMGKINKFLEKPTVRVVEYANDKDSVFRGYCEEHWRRKELLKELQAGEKLPKNDELFIKNILLQIVCDCKGNCVPIENGAVIRITGDRMTIRHHDAYSETYVYGEGIKKIKLMGRNSSTVFRHFEGPNHESDLLRGTIQELFYNTSNSFYYFNATEVAPLGYDSEYNELFRSLTDKMESIISIMDLTKSTLETELDLDYGYGTAKVDVFIDIDRNRKHYRPGEESIHFTYDGEQFSDCVELILAIVNAICENDDGYDEEDEEFYE